MAAAVVVTLVTGCGLRSTRCGCTAARHRQARDGRGDGRMERFMADGAAGVAGSAARELAAEILRLLTASGRTVAAAESLTGGLVAAALTDVPGSSTAFRGGVVAYATELKARLLGVDSGMLAGHGPVYAPVAVAMAEGVRKLLDATVGVAT